MSALAARRAEPTVIDLDGTLVMLPISYRNARGLIALFPAHLGRVRALMPTPAYVPARLGPGLGVVAVAAYEYPDSDLGPYNELAIAVPLAEGPNLPGGALLSALRSGRTPMYVHRLPVTTELACQAGRAPYGFPKWVAGIDFDDQPARLTASLSDTGASFLSLDAKLPARAPSRVRLDVEVRLWDDGAPQSCLFAVQAQAATATSALGAARLRLGAHPIARELAALLVGHRSVYLQHLQRFDGTLYGPDSVGPALASRLGTQLSALADARRPELAGATT